MVEVQFGGEPQDDIQEFRVREGGIQLADGPDHALVAQMLEREIHEVEVDPFEEHPRGVGQSRDGMISREAIELVYRLYFSDVRKAFGHT